jgi:hypothetical protein
MNRRSFFASLFAPIVARCSGPVPTIPIDRTPMWVFNDTMSPKSAHILWNHYSEAADLRMYGVTSIADINRRRLDECGLELDPDPRRIAVLEPGPEIKSIAAALRVPVDQLEADIRAVSY